MDNLDRANYGEPMSKIQLNIGCDKYPDLPAQVKQYCDRNRIQISDFAHDAFQVAMASKEGGKDKQLRNLVEGLDEDVSSLRERLNRLQARFEKLFGS